MFRSKHPNRTHPNSTQLIRTQPCLIQPSGAKSERFERTQPRPTQYNTTTHKVERYHETRVKSLVHPQSIIETRIESGTEFSLVVSLVVKLGLFNLDSAVDHILLKQSAPTVVHADELEVGIAGFTFPLSSSIGAAKSEELSL